VARVEKQLQRLGVREAELNQQLLDRASDYEAVAELGAQLALVAAERQLFETEWLDASALLE
jgi:ATP-binding cassette subfamily F protein uup